MRIQEQFEVDSPIERVYGELNDVAEIGQCIAGFKSVDMVDESHSRWKFVQRFGAIAKTFDLEATISDRQPLELITFQAASREVSIDGHVQLHALSPERTQCEILIDVEVIGPLAPLVEIFAKGPQKALILKTVSNLRARLEATAGDGAPAAMPAPSP